MKAKNPHIISQRRYNHLAKFSQINDEEKQQMKDFEENERNKIKKQTKIINYFKKVRTMDKSKKTYRPLEKEVLWNDFKNAFFENEKKQFVQDKLAIENIKPIFYYFLSDFNNFKNCDNVSGITVPNLDKGLLIVGDFGSGKTATMKALEKATIGSKYHFKHYTANDVVTRYEACTNQIQKDELMREFCIGTRYFDDLLAERDASNYGKFNLFREILDKRHANRKRTFITINYNPEFPGNVKKALEYMGERYGARVYDRLFEMFNVIEFRCESRR